MAYILQHDIIVFTETWLATDEAVYHPISGYQHFAAGRQKASQHGGVSVFVKEDIHASLLATTCHPEVVWVLLGDPHECSTCTLLGACYFSPSNSKQQHTDPFDEVAIALMRHRAQYNVLLVGDFNARCGDLNDTDAIIHPALLADACTMNHICPPRCSMDKIVNSYGSSCIAFCKHHDVVMLNGRVNGDQDGALTYYSTSSASGSMIDLALASPALLSACSLVVGESVPLFDHCPVTLTMQGRSFRKSVTHVHAKHGSRAPRKCVWDQQNWKRYAHVVTSDVVQARLCSIVQGLGAMDKAHFDAAMTSFCNCLARCTKRAFGNRSGGLTAHRATGRGAAWWDDDCARVKKEFYAVYKADKYSNLTTFWRRQYQNLLRHKREMFMRSRDADLLTSLKRTPHLFWKMYQSREKECALNDVEDWCSYFDELFNVAPDVDDDSRYKSIADLRLGLHTAVISDNVQTHAHRLSDPINITEVVKTLAKVANSKATADGFISEIFKYATVLDSNGIPTHNALAPMLTSIFNRCFIGGAGIPLAWHTAYVTPLYKGKGDKLLKNNYRGLTVTCALYKIYAMILNSRLDSFCETHGIRAHTQCGFRKDLGTTSGLFALRHTIHATCGSISKGGLNSPLYVRFVDFKKAFDSVVRPLIWERLLQIGVTGDFLAAIKDLYSHTHIHVKVNGKTSVGYVITVSGVKQGCPLSPVLFGLFIEQLHELLSVKCGDIGVVVIDEARLRDIFYADDVTFVAHSAEELQRLINCLEDFCKGFGIHASTDKSLLAVFYPKRGRNNHPVPLRILYRDTELPVKPEVVYLGGRVHERKWFGTCAESLAASAQRALMALNHHCTSIGVVSIETKLRLFDILVHPVGSYGCQVWGVDYFNMNTATHILNNPLQKVQLLFLRMISGCKKSTCRWSLLREYGLWPVQLRWICLCVRFWNKALKARNLDSTMMKSDILLFQRGCDDCWSAKFLRCMLQLRLVDATSFSALRRMPLEALTRLFFCETAVHAACAKIYEGIWSKDFVDPRAAPSRGAALNKYLAWFHDAASEVQHHLKLFLPPFRHRCLMKFRLGSWALRCHDHSILNRNDRKCTRCDLGLVEDEFHVVFECPSYDFVRCDFPDIFPWDDPNMNSFINGDSQRDIVDFIFAIYRARFCQPKSLSLHDSMVECVSSGLDLFDSDYESDISCDAFSASDDDP